MACFNPERSKRRKDPESRFWNKVIKEADGCWNWTAASHVFGYGTFGISTGKVVAAHRYSFELANGRIPDGLSVLHSCDNPKCVNPGHLRLGTKAENSKDMVSRNRSSAGEKAAFSKLTSQDVIAILTDDRTQSEIAMQYNVSQTTISNIKSGRVWKHISAP